MSTSKNVETKASLSSSSSLKFPYPVLNDKRDFKTILDILNDKENELNKKMKHTKINYKKSDDSKKKEKLKVLYKNIKEQLAKIEKQIEYIKINIKIKKIEKLREKKEDKEYKKEQYDELNGQLSRLTFFMKEANLSFLNESKLQQKKLKATTTTTTVTVASTINLNAPSTSTVSTNDQNIFDLQKESQNETNIGPKQAYYQQLPPNMINTYNQWQNAQTKQQSTMVYNQLGHQQPPQHLYKQGVIQQSQHGPYYHSPVIAQPPQPQLNENYIADPIKRAEYIQNTLAMAIAQTAAAAHAHAAIAAIAINPPPPPPSNDDHNEQIAMLPTKFEIDKASNKFEQYKAKIKFLLEADKKVVKPTNSLKTLISAYKDDEEENEDEEMIVDNDNSKIEKKDENYNNDNKNDDIKNDDVDDDDDDTEYSSDNSDTEVDIVFKSNSKDLNYVLPSTKSCGLQASLRSNFDEYLLIDNPKCLIINESSNKNKSSLLIAQRSSFSVTCMGNSSILTKNLSLKDILYKKFNRVK